MKRTLKGERESATPEMRDQEVVRANRELAAYFKGLRTEREARAALKIIKAFVRDRERSDSRRRRPLPGMKAAPAPKHAAARARKTSAASGGRQPRRTVQQRAPNDRVEDQTAALPDGASAPDEPT